ncbi:hypothetical protein K439DRAFT_1615838 [Ramaria rubella]|nr:hypothetical protein K439DRAFT_1615838 [Ramaria rubella]
MPTLQLLAPLRSLMKLSGLLRWKYQQQNCFISVFSPSSSLLCLLDIQAMDHSDSDTSMNSSQAEFHNAVKDCCVVTGYPADTCKASHILPHTKGDEYIQRFSIMCATDGQPIINDISDCRNGLFMELNCHDLFNEGQIAFLPIPNYALTYTDIPLAADSTMPANPCLILQWIYPLGHTQGAEQLLLQHPHGQVVCQPTEPAKFKLWPPAYLLEAAYGAAAFKKWGKHQFQEQSIHCVHSKYYNGQANNDEGSNGGGKHKDSIKERADRVKRRADKKTKSEEVDAFDLWTMLWEFSARQERGSDMVKYADHKGTDGERHQGSWEKVSKWLKTTM